MIMLCILYVIFFLYLILRLIIIFNHRRIGTEFIINISILAYYVIPGIRHTTGGFISIYAARYGTEFGPTYYAFFLIFTFYFVFTLIMHIKIDKLSNSELTIRNEIIKTKKVVAYILLFSVICFLAYCHLFGGVGELLKSIHKIRGGEILSSNAKYEFISKLYNVILYAPVLSIGFWNKKKNMRLLIVISLLFSFLIQVSKGSRGSMLLFFLIFIVAKINTVKSFEKTIKWGTIIAVLGFLFIVLYRPFISSAGLIAEHGLFFAMENFIDTIMNGGRYSVSSPSVAIASLLDSFDHYYVSLEAALENVRNGIHQHNYLQELLIMLLSPLPSLILGFNKGTSITVYNSMYIAGRKGVAQIPPGIIGSAYYSGGLLWVILYAFVIAFIGKLIDNYYDRIKKNVTFAHQYYAAILFTYFGFSASGDFADNFKKELTSLILYFIIRQMMVKVRKNEDSSSVVENRYCIWGSRAAIGENS